jgi:DNA-binding MarR family transcriptional regulator
MPDRPLPPGLPDEPTVRIANRLNSAAIHLLRRISRSDTADGVTGARLSALSVVVYGGGVSLGALARAERVATPTMTRIVDALVRDGLLRREAVAGDRRMVRLEATEAGRALMERGRARRIRALAEELATLPREDLEALDLGLDVLVGLEDRDDRGAGR